MKRPEFNQWGPAIPLRRPLMTAEPSIVIRELKKNDLFLIFASDGLWEHLTDETAVEIVSKNPQAVSISSFFSLDFHSWIFM